MCNAMQFNKGRFGYLIEENFISSRISATLLIDQDRLIFMMIFHAMHSM